MPERGWETVTIPGAVSGWRALSQRFGELPFADLFEPAIRYARDGFAVSPIVAEKWTLAMPHMPRDLGWFEHFAAAWPRAAPGETWSSAAHGRDAREDRARPTAKRSTAASSPTRWCGTRNRLRRAHTLEDFAAHTADWVTPLGIDYRGVTVHEIPPNGQGIAALMALGMLESFDLASMPPDSPPRCNTCRSRR